MEGMIEDPVCGMEINMETAPAKIEYEGQIYYFCSQECKETFVKNPEEYIFPNEADVR